MVWYGPWQEGLVVTIRVGLEGNLLGQVSTPQRSGVFSPLDGIVTTEASRAQSDTLYHDGWTPPLPEPYNGTEGVSEGTWDAMTRAGWNSAEPSPQLGYDTAQISSAPPSGHTIWEHAGTRATVSWEEGVTLTPAPTTAEQTAAGAISWQSAVPPLVPDSEVQELEIINVEFDWSGPGEGSEGDWRFLRRDPGVEPPSAVENYEALPLVEGGADLTTPFQTMWDTGETFGLHFVHFAAWINVWPGWYGMDGIYEEGQAGSPSLLLTLRGMPWRWVFPGTEPEPEIPAVAFRRTFPRHDSLAGGATRNYPPSRAVQTSNRIGGGYL